MLIFCADRYILLATEKGAVLFLGSATSVFLVPNIRPLTNGDNFCMLISSKEVALEDQPIYEHLLRALSQKGVRYVLCGGMALVLRHIKRDTFDADLAVDLQSENISCFLGVLNELQWMPRVPVNAREFVDPMKRAEWQLEKNAKVFTFVKADRPFLSIDVFLSMPIPFDILTHDAIPVMLDDVEIPTASYEALLEMKRQIQPPRVKDALDILILEKIVAERKR